MKINFSQLNNDVFKTLNSLKEQVNYQNLNASLFLGVM